MRSQRQQAIAPLDVPVALLLLAALVGLLAAYEPAAGLSSVAALWSGGLVYLLARAWGLQPGRRAARVAVLSGGLAAAYFLTQYGHYNPLEKVGAITRLGQILAAPFPAVLLWQPLGNGMATLLEGLLFLAIGSFIGEQDRRWQRIAAICAALMALAILISESRGAWLAVGAAGLAWLAQRYRAARWLGLSALGGLAVLVLVVLIAGDISVLDRIPIVRGTLAPLFIRPDRLEVYRQAAALLRDVPYTGIGPGDQFAMEYSHYALLIQVPYLTYAHNFFLETWLELGLPGIAALLWMIATLAALPRSANPRQNAARIGLLAVGLHGLTDARPFSDLWCWPAIFLLLGLSTDATGWPTRRAARLAGPLAAGAFILLAVLLTGAPLAAWQTNLGAVHQARGELSTRLNAPQKQAEIAQAEALFRQALARQPAQAGANLRLGLILTDREQFAAALPYLEAAYRADPGRIAAAKALGLAYTWNGQIEPAADLLKDVHPPSGMAQELNDWGNWRVFTRRQVELGKNAYRVSLQLAPDQPAVQAILDDLSPR